MIVYGPPKGHLRIVKSIPNPKANRIVAALESVLKSSEPSLMRFLRSMWDDQQNGITYADIRDAILEGVIDEDWLKQWQQQYASFVVEKLRPKWLDAMKDAVDAQLSEHDGFDFDLTQPEINNWIETHGTKLAVGLSKVQHEAIKSVVQQAAVGNFGPDELARAIRPMVGLTPRQARACEKYYEALREDGMKAPDARAKAANYAANAHRYRAQNIARTELVTAFNQGADQGVRQAQQQGYVGQMKKKWLTAEDERVCNECGPLDEVETGMDDSFPDGPALPPHHPLCRCVVIYEEVSSTG